MSALVDNVESIKSGALIKRSNNLECPQMMKQVVNHLLSAIKEQQKNDSDLLPHQMQKMSKTKLRFEAVPINLKKKSELTEQDIIVEKARAKYKDEQL